MSKTRDAVQGPDITQIDGTSHIEVARDDLYLMLISSLRYAMGRSSYITGSTAEAVRKYARYLTEGEVRTLSSALTQELERVAKLNTTLGMPVDHDSWFSLEIWLSKHIQDME